MNFFPIPIINVINYLDTIPNKSSKDCIFFKESLLKELTELKHISSSSLNFQINNDGGYLQDRGQRIYSNKTDFTYKQDMFYENIYLNFQIKRDYDSNKYIFDESYISILSRNLVITLGRKERWWSPSSETSLILSNSARPSLGIEVSSYKPFIPKSNFFNYLLGDIQFSIFLNKLEKNREIPNALLLGNRVSFQPNSRLNFSLVRIAQFGGDGRPTDKETIINMILGKDTTNRRLKFEDQPGNQIAGIDFSINLYADRNKRVNLFGQYYGEDGLDPIINDSLGAIFPSKRFGSGGIKLIRSDYQDKPLIISIEHINTDSGWKNVVYNHSIYKTGYRYYDLPIGANIDADSINRL